MTTLDDKDFYLYAEQPAFYIIQDMAKSASKRVSKPQHKLKSKWTKLVQSNHAVLSRLEKEL